MCRTNYCEFKLMNVGAIYRMLGLMMCRHGKIAQIITQFVQIRKFIFFSGVFIIPNAYFLFTKVL